MNRFNIINKPAYMNGGIMMSADQDTSVKAIRLDLRSVSLELGSPRDSFQLIPLIRPLFADDQRCVWVSSDISIATVSEGLVCAITPGVATITVTTVDGGFWDTCIVNVIVKVVGISIDIPVNSLCPSLTTTILVAIEPVHATNQEVLFSSSDDNIATVDVAGIITAVAPGVATITVTTVDGGFSAAHDLFVYPIETAPDNPTPR